MKGFFYLICVNSNLQKCSFIISSQFSTTYSLSLKCRDLRYLISGTAQSSSGVGLVSHLFISSRDAGLIFYVTIFLRSLYPEHCASNGNFGSYSPSHSILQNSSNVILLIVIFFHFFYSSNNIIENICCLVIVTNFASIHKLY